MAYLHVGSLLIYRYTPFLFFSSLPFYHLIFLLMNTIYVFLNVLNVEFIPYHFTLGLHIYRLCATAET